MRFRPDSLSARWSCGRARRRLRRARRGQRRVSLDVASGKAHEEWSRTYTLTQRWNVEIVNVNGAINRRRGNGTQVEVKAIRQARAPRTKRRRPC